MKNRFLIKNTKIKVIGIGGGGSAIVGQLAKKIKKVTFLAANTDVQALRKLPHKVYKFKFGQDLTHGLGTGMDPELGKSAAEKEKQRIKRILKGQDLCIFIASLGGGTGSGATPVFASVSHELGNINLGIFTLPFKFEGEKRVQIAKEALAKLKQHLNAFLVIQNQRIFKVIDKKTSLEKAFFTLNKILADNLASLVNLIYEPGLINIDFADFKTMLDEIGEKFYFNTAEAKGPDRVDTVIKKILSPVLFDFNIKTAKKILFNITAGDDLKMKEVEQISNTFSNLNPYAKIIFGVSLLPSSKSSTLKVTLLVVGDSKKKKIKSKLAQEEKKPEIKKKEKKEEIKEKKVRIKVKRQKKKKTKKKTKKQTKKQKKRLSALEIKKALQEEERKMLAEQEKWEIPAFLRRSPWKEKIKALTRRKKK